ncbi:MAG TPA: hypothetical protein PK154_10350, partial [Methanoregulaceae archaeon]|nr:hypothetical protein [Methanoregulaceae archaeon]
PDQGAYPHHANPVQARILVIGVNDPVSTRAVSTPAPQTNPGLFIIGRNRFLPEGRYPGNLGAEWSYRNRSKHRWGYVSVPMTT